MTAWEGSTTVPGVGGVMALGDLDQNGTDDLVIGVPGDGTRAQAGGAALVFLF